jgi:hypothetical protein
MRRSIALPVGVLFSTLLCSCGFMTPAQQYAGEQKASTEVAVIQSYHGSLFGNEYHATISGYAYTRDNNAPMVKRFGLPGFTDFPREIQLNPGNYVLELYCFKSLTKPTFRPILDVSLKAGYTYTVKCNTADGKAYAVVSQEARTF